MKNKHYKHYKHYTTTSYVRWEKCNVPLCDDNVAEDPTTTTTAAIPIQNDAVSTNEPGFWAMTFWDFESITLPWLFSGDGVIPFTAEEICEARFSFQFVLLLMHQSCIMHMYICRCCVIFRHFTLNQISVKKVRNPDRGNKALCNSLGCCHFDDYDIGADVGTRFADSDQTICQGL